MEPKTPVTDGVQSDSRQDLADSTVAETAGSAVDSAARSEVSVEVASAPSGQGAVAQASMSNQLGIPLSLVSRSDLSRTLRELISLDDYFHQTALRGSKPDEVPTVSKTLDELAVANNLNLLQPDHRSTLKDFLTRLKGQAPTVHVSFPSEASDPFVAKILEWFRTNTHPHVLLHIGLMPELAAGCLVRTTNKMFDFSFRKRFEQSKVKLMEALVGLDNSEERVAVADANATVAPEDRLVPGQPEAVAQSPASAPEAANNQSGGQEG